MNRSGMQRQVLQAGTQVDIDSKGRRSERPMQESVKRAGLIDGVREFTTGMKRRTQTAGLRRGGVVKKAGGRYD